MKFLGLAAAAATLALTAFSPAHAASNKCVWANSHYVTWEGVQYAQDSGILAKWNKKYGVEIMVTEPMKYADSITQFAAGEFCALSVTNMDALQGPATGGITTRFVAAQDTSHGNDGLACKTAKPISIAELKGRTVYLVEGTVSHYGLARWLQSAGLKLSDVHVSGIDDENKIVATFKAAPQGSCVVTWKPFLDDALQVGGVHLVTDSSKGIAYEIIDGVVVNDNLASDNVKKAIAGAWYEVAAIIADRGSSVQKKAIEMMASSSGVTPAAFNAQLATTNLFSKPAASVDFLRDAARGETMKMIGDFLFANGFMPSVKSADEVGIQLPTTTVGNAKNVKLIFDDSFAKMAAEGKL